MIVAPLLALAGAMMIFGAGWEIFRDHPDSWIRVVPVLGAAVMLGALFWLLRRLDQSPSDVVPPALLPCTLILAVMFLIAGNWISGISYLVLSAGLIIMILRQRRLREHRVSAAGPGAAPDRASPAPGH